MRVKKLFVPLAVALCLSIVLIAFAEIEAIDTSGAWRIPFDGVHKISCGPHEGAPGCKHILTSGNDSREAIDYPAIPPDRPPFQVVAPTNGTVLDICDVSDFGTVLRINHGGVYSFFAHLSSVSVVANQPVKQGDAIAMSGTSGTGGSNNHLHFEARNGAVAPCGNGSGAYTGSAYPIRALPGHWWNTWYSPPPNLQRDPTLISGGAQYPEKKKRPTVTSPGARHLSNQQSPPNVLAGWMSNINTSAVTLHFGAAPDTPGTNWATVFSVYEFRQNCNCWSAISGGPDITGPWWTVQIGSWNQSESNGQHTFNAFDENDIPLTSGDILRYWEVLPAGSTSDIPHLTATYRNTTTPTTLQFCSDAEKYKIYEDHGGGSQVAFNGVGCSIMVHRQVGGINRYSVAARVGGVWTSPSPWLVVHD